MPNEHKDLFYLHDNKLIHCQLNDQTCNKFSAKHRVEIKKKKKEIHLFTQNQNRKKTKSFNIVHTFKSTIKRKPIFTSIFNIY